MTDDPCPTIRRRRPAASTPRPWRRTRADAVGAFYAQYAGRVKRAVRARVNACDQTIEDACQTAWVRLLGAERVTLDGRGAGWVTTVAVREGWRLASTRRELPAGGVRLEVLEDVGIGEPIALDGDAAEQAMARIEHDARVVDLHALKVQERRALGLQAFGFRYREIAAITDSTYTAVNRRIAEGRVRLRLLQEQREPVGRGVCAQAA